MKVLQEYITRDIIIAKLCSIRARNADKVQKRSVLINLVVSPDSIENKMRIDEAKLLNSCFPSRKYWVELNIKQRASQSSSIERNKLSLKITIRNAEKEKETPPWLKNLNRIVVDIQQCFYKKNYKVAVPQTFPSFKKKEGKRISCRPLSTYPLKDRIVLSLANSFLTDIFDNLFYEHSYAFRGEREGGERVSHQTAISKIKEYRKVNTSPQWVAECDMKKFYDSVHHSVIRKEFFELITTIKKEKKCNLEDIGNITRVFLSYLDSYCFYKQVFSYNRDDEYFSKHGFSNGYFEWIEEELLNNNLVKNENTLKGKRIGVPQGGALSGLIANMVLNKVDREIKDQVLGKGLYLRFCDDMILVMEDQTELEKQFSLYLKLLKDNKLIAHPPKDITASTSLERKKFWNTKSKSPYMWGSRGCGGYEWVTFVGYDIRFDGDIRVRKSSLQKEKAKQKKKVDEVLKLLSLNPPRRPREFILGSVEKRLIGMSVSCLEIWNYKNKENDMCWLSGFTELEGNIHVKKQLRELDHNRHKQLSRLSKELNKLPDSDFRNVKDDTTNSQSKIIREKIYKGAPFSYYSQFIDHKHSKA